MWTRRQFLAGSSLAGWSLLGGLPGGGHAQDPSAEPGNARDLITPETQRAIDQGLAFLARRQHRDGSYGSHPQYQGNVAITSLAALAMMAGGHQPGRGAYSRVVTKALNYVLDQEEDGKGYLHSRSGASHGPMYGHGFGTLFLAEVHGMVGQRELRDRLHGTLKRAVKLIVDSQNAEGGWRYYPGSKDADISVTICQIMALRAARNAGIFVPKSTVEKCIKYVKLCQTPEGGFRYMAQAGQGRTGDAFARTAAGVVALYCAGVYKGPEVESGLKFLMEFKPRGDFRRDLPPMHYFYGHYYAVQAMWTAGNPYWAEWYPAVRDELLSHPHRSRQDGSWMDHRICADYGTAMACIILQIPNNFLPIIQK